MLYSGVMCNVLYSGSTAEVITDCAAIDIDLAHCLPVHHVVCADCNVENHGSKKKCSSSVYGFLLRLSINGSSGTSDTRFPDEMISVIDWSVWCTLKWSTPATMACDSCLFFSDSLAERLVNRLTAGTVSVSGHRGGGAACLKRSNEKRWERMVAIHPIIVRSSVKRVRGLIGGMADSTMASTESGKSKINGFSTG